jgi:putative ABC transport system permease protein
MTCANVVNLLLLRAVASQQEIAIRSALGASRKRVLCQLLLEGLLLSCIGVFLGLSLAKLGLVLLRTYTAGFLPRAESLGLTPVATGISALVCILLVVLCTAVPVFRVIRGSSAAALKQGPRATANRSQLHAQTFLLWVEVSLAVTVLIGTGLLLRSFHALLNVELGYQPHHILTMHINLADYSDQQIARFFDRLFPSLQEMPGVDSVAAVSVDPLTAANTRFAIADAPMPGVGHFPTAQFRGVTPDYFKVLHIPQWNGRGFTREDCGTNRILVNRSMVRKYFDGADPVGRALLQGFFRSPPLVRLPIIGVVGDVKDTSIEGETIPTFYYCQTNDQSTLLIRTSMDPSAMNVSIEKVLHAVDPNLAVNHVVSLDQRIDDSLWRQKVSAWLFAIFAAFALLITVTGVSSVFSYSLAQRSKEIAVRIALGATKTDLTQMLLRQIFSVVLPGILAGLVLAAVFSRTLSSLLFHVAPHDFLVFAVVPVLLSAIILLAAGKPVRQGLRTDPMEALRGE